MRQKQRVFSLFLLSPSSRRAWIEIARTAVSSRWSVVALLTEGVDRNSLSDIVNMLNAGSPSSRRAWIEMSGETKLPQRSTGRPPHGGRG